MLLVWDIHINTRYQDKILTELRNIFSTYPDEKNIIFSWDYVYHFAYDRNSLLQLYGLFIELFKQGKNVYIISGNHDRLGNSFVFEEAQKAFETIINDKVEMIDWIGKIKFITKPLLQTIEGEDILFMPFFLPSEHKESDYIPQNERLKSITEFSTILQKSPHKQEQFSWYINKLIAEYVDKNPNITIFHHYYTNGTAFPWQKSKFNYKDIAINEQFLDIPSIKFISGHLHQPFSYRNYLCLWSVWSTSSLETNQNKYIFQYTTTNKKITATPLMINPQISIRSTEQITEQIINNTLQHINETNAWYFTSPIWNIDITTNNKPNLKNISLTLNVEHIDYDKIHEIIDDKLRKSCQEIRLKKDIKNMDALVSSFKVSSNDLNGFADWKNILQEYIQKKFGDDYPKYEKVMKELKLL